MPSLNGEKQSQIYQAAILIENLQELQVHRQGDIKNGTNYNIQIQERLPDFAEALAWS
jgi:hypothetical protein